MSDKDVEGCRCHVLGKALNPPGIVSVEWDWAVPYVTMMLKIVWLKFVLEALFLIFVSRK